MALVSTVAGDLAFADDRWDGIYLIGIEDWRPAVATRTAPWIQDDVFGALMRLESTSVRTSRSEAGILISADGSNVVGRPDDFAVLLFPDAESVTGQLSDAPLRIDVPGERQAVIGLVDADGSGTDSVVLFTDGEDRAHVHALDQDGCVLAQDGDEITPLFRNDSGTITRHLDFADLDGDGYDDVIAARNPALSRMRRMVRSRG